MYVLKEDEDMKSMSTFAASLDLRDEDQRQKIELSLRIRMVSVRVHISSLCMLAQKRSKETSRLQWRLQGVRSKESMGPGLVASGASNFRGSKEQCSKLTRDRESV